MANLGFGNGTNLPAMTGLSLTRTGDDTTDELVANLGNGNGLNDHNDGTQANANRATARRGDLVTMTA